MIAGTVRRSGGNGVAARPGLFQFRAYGLTRAWIGAGAEVGGEWRRMGTCLTTVPNR